MKGHWKQWIHCSGVSVGKGKKATTGAKNETFDLSSHSHWVSLRLDPEIEKTGVKIKVPVPARVHTTARGLFMISLFVCVIQHIADFFLMKIYTNFHLLHSGFMFIVRDGGWRKVLQAGITSLNCWPEHNVSSSGTSSFRPSLKQTEIATSEYFKQWKWQAKQKGNAFSVSLRPSG